MTTNQTNERARPKTSERTFSSNKWENAFAWFTMLMVLSVPLSLIIGEILKRLDR